MDPALVGLIVLVSLLALSFTLTTSQIALSNVARPRLRDRAEEGDRQAGLAVRLAEESTRTLSTFQIANMVVRFLIAALTAAVLLPALREWSGLIAPGIVPGGYYLLAFAVLFPLAGLVVYILTSLIPQVMAQYDAEGWSVRLAGFAQVTIFLLKPLVSLTTALRRTLAGPGGDPGAYITEERIKTMVDAGEEEGAIDLDEKEMIYSIFGLDETVAREIMVPRIDVVALDIGTPLDEARALIIEAGHSRIPVYEESLDHVRGLLYAKDLLEVWHEGKTSVDLRTLLRPALFVPESKRVSDLLRELQRAAVHLAIVIDEYGGTAGLVTIEDIVEEIVGEIMDEYDYDEEAAYQQVAEDEYIFDARYDLDDFNDLLDASLPDDLSDTLGGFIYERLGKVPEVGETVQTDEFRLEVLSVENQRIGKVRVKLNQPQESVLTPKRKEKEKHVKTGNSH